MAKPQSKPESSPDRAPKQPRKDSPETEALRAVRDMRELKERADNAFAIYQRVRNECSEQNAEILTGLSASAAVLVKKLTDSEEKEAAQ